MLWFAVIIAVVVALGVAIVVCRARVAKSDARIREAHDAAIVKVRADLERIEVAAAKAEAAVAATVANLAPDPTPEAEAEAVADWLSGK
jgi:hypothetical protein